MGLQIQIFPEILKKNYRGKKVLEFPETCKSAKKFFAHSRKKLGKNPLVPFAQGHKHNLSLGSGALRNSLDFCIYVVRIYIYIYLC